MRNGLYLLARLGGASVDFGDVSIFQLPSRAHDDRARDCVVRAVNRGLEYARARFDRPDGAAFLVGHLDDPAALADTLGVPRDLGEAGLVDAALDRFGDETPSRALGEWTYLRWDSVRHTVIAMTSATCGDRMYVAVAGDRVAIAPDLALLARLPWVDTAFCDRGVLLQLARARLRNAATGETILRGVVRVRPGTCVTISAGEPITTQPVPPSMPPSVLYHPDTAIAEIEALLRKIVRQTIERHDGAAFMLSGGLDSTLLATLGADMDRISLLSSAAPPGTTLADETPFARLVAERLGMPLVPVWPSATANVYRPSARMLSLADGPVGSPRHYVYEALYKAALDAGQSCVIDGMYGEFTISGYPNHATGAPPPRSAIDVARMLRNRLAQRLRDTHWRRAAFHVRLSRNAMAAIPPDFEDIWRREAPTSQRAHGDAIGIHPAMARAWAVPTATTEPELRHAYPFRDPRLVAMMATMPTSLLRRDGLTRAPARLILADKVSDVVRLRTHGMPFSPTYNRLLVAQAEAARARIPAFRETPAGDWLDLDWLDSALKTIATRGLPDYPTALQIQCTVLAAEFFAWWANDGSL